MKYTCEVEINAPISQVVEQWKDEASLHKWQDGFKRIERISGEPGEVGSQAKIYFDNGKHKIELLETIQLNNLPAEIVGLYEHVHMTNTQRTSFKALAENRTLYRSEVEYTAFHSFMPKLMARLFPGMFRKQSQKWMNQFKFFIENGQAVNL